MTPSSTPALLLLAFIGLWAILFSIFWYLPKAIRLIQWIFRR